MDSQCFQVVETRCQDSIVIVDNGKTYLDLSHSLDSLTSGRPSNLCVLNAETRKSKSCNRSAVQFVYVNPDDTGQTQTVSGNEQSTTSHLAFENAKGHAALLNDETIGFHFIGMKTEDDQYKFAQTSCGVKQMACETFVIQDVIPPDPGNSDLDFVCDTGDGRYIKTVNDEKITLNCSKLKIPEETTFCNPKNSDLHSISTNTVDSRHVQTTNSEKISASLLNISEEHTTIPNPTNSNADTIRYVHTANINYMDTKLKIPEEACMDTSHAYSRFIFMSDDKTTKRGRFRRGSGRSIARDNRNWNKRSCVAQRIKPAMFTAHDQRDLLLRVTRCNNDEIARLSEERRKQKSEEIKILSDSVPRFIPTSEGNVVKETFTETLLRLLKEKLSNI